MVFGINVLVTWEENARDLSNFQNAKAHVAIGAGNQLPMVSAPTAYLKICMKRVCKSEAGDSPHNLYPKYLGMVGKLPICLSFQEH